MGNKHPLIQLTMCLLGLIVLMTVTITACNRDNEQEVANNDFETLIETPSVNIDGDDLKIRYKSAKDNEPIWLVYNQKFERVHLEVPGDNTLGFSDEVTDRLIQEIAWLTTTVGSSPLGDTGYYFTYEGQFPIWGPYHTLGPDGAARCLFFAENARLDAVTNTIYAIGRKDEAQLYNLYSEDLAAEVAKIHGNWLDE